MPVKVIVPELGESVVEGEIGKWFKEVGDKVEMDEPIVTIETDKIEMEVPSPASGVLVEKFAKEGEVVNVKQIIGVIAREGEEYEPGSIKPGEMGAEASSAPIDTSYMEAGAGEEEAKQEAPAGGIPREVDEDLGGYAATTVGEVIEVDFSQFAQEEKKEEAPPPPPPPAAPAAGDGAKATFLSPAVRRLIEQYNLDPAKIQGTGRGGRIRKVDIERIIEAGEVEKYQVGAPTPAAAPAAPAKEQVVPEKLGVLVTGEYGPEERVKLPRIRKTIAERMQQSKNTAAHTYDIQEADLTKLVALREKYKEEFQARYGVKLTYMAFFIKAVVAALKKFPYFNASITDDHSEAILKKYYNIGIAVNTDDGLVVPNIKDADRKSIVELSQEVAELAERARNRELTLDDLQGGTFTITNAGGFGTLISCPVINYPEVGILGVHNIKKRPVVDESGQIVVRDMVYLTVAFDHRLIDGVYAVEFNAYIVEQLENPEWMLLQI